MATQVVAQANNINAPSLLNVKCPHCASNNLRILGIKGAVGAAVAVGFALGAIGHMITDAANKDSYSYEPLNFKCEDCRKKFESYPLVAQPNEILSEPCRIVFKRLSSFVGMAVSQTVWINGMKIGTVKNGKTLEFGTIVKYNKIFVTDQYGVAFKGDYKFEAQPGGIVEVNFKRKFV